MPLWAVLLWPVEAAGIARVQLAGHPLIRLNQGHDRSMSRSQKYDTAMPESITGCE